MYFFKKIIDLGLTVTFFLLSIYALVVNRVETMLINTRYWRFWEALMKQENRQKELTFWTWLRWAETVWRVHPHNAPILPLPLYIVLVQYIGFLACFATAILGTCLVLEIPLESWIQDWLKPAKPEMPIDLIFPSCFTVILYLYVLFFLSLWIYTKSIKYKKNTFFILYNYKFLIKYGRERY